MLSQDGEHAGSIRTGQHRSHQKSLLPGEVEQIVQPHGGQPRRSRHAQGRHGHSLPCHAFGSAPLGVEAAVKHDKHQAHGANGLRLGEVRKLNFQDSVTAAEHSDEHEQNQRGQSQAVRTLFRSHTEDQHQRNDQYGCGHSRFPFQNVSFILPYCFFSCNPWGEMFIKGFKRDALAPQTQKGLPTWGSSF